jgi:hypothetical protein
LGVNTGKPLRRKLANASGPFKNDAIQYPCLSVQSPGKVKRMSGYKCLNCIISNGYIGTVTGKLFHMRPYSIGIEQ